MNKIKNLLVGNKFLTFWSVLFVIILIIRMVRRASIIISTRQGNIADCFINYEGGFVRRGLLGQGLFELYKVGIDPLYVLLFVLFIVSLFLVVYFVEKSRSLGIGWQILLPCYLLGGIPIYDYRRDYLLVIAFILIIYLYKKVSFHKWVVLANIVTIITILCYEAFLFICFPFLYLISNSKTKKWLLSALYWIPSVITFFVCCYFKGSFETGQAIIESVKPYWNDMYLISFIGKDGADVMMYHMRVNFIDFYHGIPSLLVNLISLILAIYYCIFAIPTYCVDAVWSKRNLLMVLSTFLFCLLPMLTVLSTDYGRMFWLANMCTFVIILNFDAKYIKCLFPNKVQIYSERVISFAEKYFAPTRMKVILILLFSGISIWSGDIVKMFMTSEVGAVISIVYRLLGGNASV